MGFWNNVTSQSVASARDGFKEFQIGDNTAVVKSAVEKVSESGNDMLVITFENDEGAEIRHYIVDGEFKQQKLKQFYLAFNIPLGSQNINEWIGKSGIVVCKQGKPNSNGNAYNQVSYLRPRTPQNHSAPAGRSTPQTYSAPRPQQQPATSQAQPYPTGDDEFEDNIPF